jgi:DNA replication protein DnaC
MSDEGIPKGPFRSEHSGGDAPREGESTVEWFRRVFGEMPPPTVDMDGAEEAPLRERRHEARMALERTIPPVYRWARFSAPELAHRVIDPDAIADARALCQSTRVVLMGPSRAGKTSLAVAMLRQWVSESSNYAGFIPSHRVGIARILHAAGHGEPEIVDRAMTTPLALLDDLGCERDTSTNPLPDVIFERYAANRPTWITTGLTREQLEKRYGTGVVTRMFDRAKVIRLGENRDAGSGAGGRTR